VLVVAALGVVGLVGAVRRDPSGRPPEAHGSQGSTRELPADHTVPIPDASETTLEAGGVG
jgi:hypothetical protein